MSMINEVAAVRPAINNRLQGFISGVNARFAQYRTYRKTFEELNALSDRELSDLGIARSSIPGIAYKAAYGN